jgi:HK97 family phage major capsid protein
MIEMVAEKRTAQTKAANDIIAAAEAEQRELTETEFAQVRDIAALNAPIDERLADLNRIADGNALAARTAPVYGGAIVRSAPQTYTANGDYSHIRDVIGATMRNDQGSWERLRRHASEVRVETRDIGRTDTAGGEFVPPLWMVDMYGDAPRPERVIANLVTQMPLPSGTDSINLPRITTGPAVAIQTADNAAVNETDMVTASVTAAVNTIAGQQDLSIQLIDQSPLGGGMDQLIYGQLAADYERVLGAQIWNGSAASGQVRGFLNTSGINAVAFTDAAPTAATTFVPVAQAVSQVHTNSYIPANAIVMAPRRWNWLMSRVDGSGRPLVVPDANGAYMAMGVQNQSLAAGYVGTMLGLPVYIDGSCPLTLGAGTNQDTIIAARFSDSVLFEGAVNTRVLPDVGSGTLTVRFQLYRYVAFTAGRRPTSVSAVNGTGLVAVTGF